MKTIVAPDKRVYILAAKIVDSGLIVSALDAISHAYDSLHRHHYIRGHKTRHLSQFKKAFDKHPWWKSRKTDNSKVKVKALELMAELCKTKAPVFTNL